MIKNIIGGICVGCANIIPGVSGGTIFVLLGLFDKIMSSISNVFKKGVSKKDRIDSIKFLFQVVLGVGIGLIVFAKVLTYLFEHFEYQTLMCFAGLILFSIPSLKKSEMKGIKLNPIYFILGLLLIGLLVYFSPGSDEVVVPLNEILAKDLNVVYILSLVIIGFIGGATMIFPGVSGSMVLLVIGWYHLFKGYVANVTSFETKVLIGLIFIAIGVLLGIVMSAKLTNFLLNKYRRATMSFIMGLIVMSTVVIIPFSGYDVITLITSIIAFILGAAVVLIFDKLKDRKETKK